MLQIGAFSQSEDDFSTDTSKIKEPCDIVRYLLTTIYLPNKGCSSETTQNLAADLAAEIGSKHYVLPISNVVNSAINSIPDPFLKPAFSNFAQNSSLNATWRQELAMQNLQARTRLLLTYLAGSTCDNGKGKLVLASSNADESLTGYLTKYDCSSGDVNPIGAISKVDLRKVVLYMAKKYCLKSLDKIYKLPPSAELKPLKEGEIAQTDEEDMGSSYEELGLFGRLRTEGRCGPLSMYRKLVSVNSLGLSKIETANKVKLFFKRYGQNRHKMTTLTPSVHADTYSPDDNRHDLRPFLMESSFSWQFEKIDKLVEGIVLAED